MAADWRIHDHYTDIAGRNNPVDRLRFVNHGMEADHRGAAADE